MTVIADRASERALEGRAAIVTGASRGVGREIAVALAAAGCRVVGVSRSGSDIGHSVVADLSSPGDVDRLAREVWATVGAPAILVNAAGTYGPLGRVADTDPDEWISTFGINTIAPYLTCRAFVPGMLRAGWGRIVNLTSAASLHPPSPLNSAYATSKVSLNHFTRSLASELEGTGVTANVLHPGDLQTDMWGDIETRANQLGPDGEPYRRWVEWVRETGGDPVEKASSAILAIIAGSSNGQFHWIDQPLQDPIPSWTAPEDARPW